MGLSIEQQIQQYISQHPHCKGKSTDEVLTIMLQDGALSDVEFTEDEKLSLFGGKNNNKIGDGVELHKKKVKKSTPKKVVKKKTKLSLSEEFSARHKATTTNLDKAEKSNGFLGKLWSGTKNLFGFGDSSNKVRKAHKAEAKLIKELDGKNKSKAFKELTGFDYSAENEEKFRKGEIKLKSEVALDGYKEGQEMAADIGGDIVSGIAAVGGYSLMLASGPVGWAGIGIATLTAVGTGAFVKSGVKALDAWFGGRKYTSFKRDLVTGGFSGVLAPLTGGLGGAVGRGTATKLLGMQATKFVGKETAEEVGMSWLKRALLNPTGYKYVGGNLFKKTGAYAIESAADGALGGGIDMAFRTAYDGGSAEEIITAAKEGAFGGLIFGPAMNLGFKGAGKLVGKGRKLIFGKGKLKGAEPEVTTPKTKKTTEAVPEAATPASHATTESSSTTSHSPIKPKHDDAFGITSILSKEQLSQTASNLLVKKGDKLVLTAEGAVIVRQAAEQIRKSALDVEPEICKIMKEMGLATEETLSHRSKGVQSLYDKIQNALIEDKTGTITLEKAINSVKDGVGVRTVNDVGNFANHPQVKKYLDAGDIKTARQKAVELESDYVLQGLMRYVDAKANGTNKVNLTRISNYMGEDGIPYFTERQLNTLKAYADSKGVKIPIVERVNSLSERLASQTDDVYRAKSTTKVRGSGYTALQMNFETLDGFTYEWQYRGKKLNSFAEGEHIPYDLRTNKDIIGTNKELTRLYEPMKKLLTDKNVMTDEMYKEYNHYLTAHYEYLRLAELGFNDGMNPPKLPKGFDERLRAENLELVHEIAEKIKKNPSKEKEYLREYESRLVRNTADNVTSDSYTAAAAARAKNRTIDRYEAEVRFGKNLNNADEKFIDEIIKHCKNSTNGISELLVSEAEVLIKLGINKKNVIKLIDMMQDSSIEHVHSKLISLKSQNPNININKIVKQYIELNRIETPKIGYVRKQNELSPKDIVNLYDIKMNTVTESTVESILSKYTNPKDRALAVKILRNMGQYADIDSLNALYKYLDDSKLILASSSQKVSSGDILSYLAAKKAFTKDLVQQETTFVQSIQAILAQNKRAALILDKTILSEIESSPNLRKILQDNPNIKLILPDGWNNGITMFNHSSVEDISVKLQHIFDETKHLVKTQNLSEQDALHQVLNGQVINFLKKHNLQNNLKIVKNDLVMNSPETISNISRQYSNKQMDKNTIEKILSKYSVEDQPYVLEVLAQTSNPASMRTLAQRTKNQHAQILKIAKDKHIKQEDIYYLVPTVEKGEGKKSYAMVSTIYRDTNDINPQRLISDISEIPQNENTMVVILDDFSGSGKSLIDNYRALSNPREVIQERIEKLYRKQNNKPKEEPFTTGEIKDINDWVDRVMKNGDEDILPFNMKSQKYNGQIVIAPLASTTGMNSAVHNFAKYTSADSKLTFMPADEIPLFLESQYFKSFKENSSESRNFLEILKPLFGFERFDPIGDKAAKWKSPNDINGYYGFRGNATSIAFPYMAPNNNNAFYSTFVAPLLTLNSAGVKNRWKLE